MMKRFLIISCLFVLLGNEAQGQLIISEILAENENGIQDYEGDHVDWIEIYNPTREPINLKNYFLSDQLDAPQKWQLHQRFVIDPGDYRIIYCSGKDTIIWGEVHTNFRISHFGESVILSNRSGLIIDSVAMPVLETDESFGTLEDSIGYFFFKNASPGFQNSREDVQRKTRISINNPFEVNGGTNEIIQWNSFGPCEKVTYSFDGSIPSEIWDGRSIIVNQDDHIPLFFSNIPTRYQYRLPKYNPRFHHIRLRCHDSSLKGFSEDQQTIFVNDRLVEHQSLPVFFVDASQFDFFDPESGIYVEGEDRNYSKNGREWRRGINWIYYSDDNIQSGQALAEIHGHATRSLPQKSLKITNASTFDSLNSMGLNATFRNDLSQFILRSYHSDLIRNEFADLGFKDDLVMRIIGNDLNVYAQKSEFTSVYINGEYWGIHSLRETSNEDLISSIEGMDAGDVIIEKGGDHIFSLYNNIKNWNNEDLDILNKLTRYFDVDNLLDYVLAELWFNNQDWPFNNIKTWRDRQGIGPYRFILFDMDACFKKPSQNAFHRFDYENIPKGNNVDHYLFFKKLLSFTVFKEALIARFSDLKNHTFSAERMLMELQIMENELEPEIEKHSDRWHYPSSIESWKKAVKEVRDFILLRQVYFNQSILNEQELNIYPNPTSSLVELDFDIDLFETYEWIGTNGNKISEPLPILTTKLETPRHTAGMLFLVLRGELGTRTLKVIVQ